MQASIVRRWLHELEAVNDLENLEPPRSLCQLPTNSKPESIRSRRNTEDTRRLSSASSHAARPLGRSTFFLVVVLPFARRMTQASLVAAHMGLLSGAHLRSMNWRGLWHELPGGAHRFACLRLPSKIYSQRSWHCDLTELSENRSYGWIRLYEQVGEVYQIPTRYASRYN